MNVRFSRDDKILAATSHKSVFLWSVQTGKLARSIDHQSFVTDVDFSPVGKTLASGTHDSSARLWDLQTGRDIGALGAIGPGEWPSIVHSVRFSPDGKSLATGDEDGLVRLWDVEKTVLQCTLKGHKNEVFRVAYSPDGKRVASSGEDGTIILWDALTRSETARFTGHTGTVTSIAFSADGRTLVSASADLATESGEVRLWDVGSRRNTHTMRGHTGFVWSVEFAGDNRVVSGGQDHTIRAWDVTTGKELASLQVDDVVGAVAVSRDGKTLAAGTEHKMAVVLWRMPWWK
jgi:WD40 repeat protein